VLEWCKIFADENGKHYWKKSIDSITTDDFMKKMLSAIDTNENDFKEYINEHKTYRDKFVAHLDKQNTMNIPDFEIAKDSVVFFYKFLIENESFTDEVNIDAAPNANDYYKVATEEAKCFLDKLNSNR